jgi:hypothetical protein
MRFLRDVLMLVLGLGSGLYLVSMTTVRATEGYRAEFAPAVVRGDPTLNAINPALIEWMRKETADTTMVQLASGARYRVACRIDGSPNDRSSCSWLFRVGIWVEN